MHPPRRCKEDGGAEKALVVVRATDQNLMRVAACEIQTAESIASYGKGKF
jgi:hypothetical protein